MRLIAPSKDPEDVLVFRARVWGALMGLFFVPVSILLAVLFHFTAWFFVLAVPGISVVIGYLVYRLTRALSSGTGQAFGAFLQPSGRGSAYLATYSLEQSLEARGDVEAAMRAYEDAIRQNPTDPEARLQAAEVNLRAGDASRAAVLFTEARSLTRPGGTQELYATQRLIDVYLGPLKDEGRAMVELRRLVERFRGTREADAAFATLSDLKASRTHSDF